MMILVIYRSLLQLVQISMLKKPFKSGKDGIDDGEDDFEKWAQELIKEEGLA